MTAPRRPPADNMVILHGLAEIKQQLVELQDDLRRNDARQDESVRRAAATDAKLDALKGDQERGQQRLENTARSNLAETTNSYRQLESSLSDIKDRVHSLEDIVQERKAEDIRAATEGSAAGAAKGAVDSNSSRAVRSTGLLAFVMACISVLAWGGKAWAVLLRLLHLSVSGDDPGSP